MLHHGDQSNLLEIGDPISLILPLFNHFLTLLILSVMNVFETDLLVVNLVLMSKEVLFLRNVISSIGLINTRGVVRLALVVIRLVLVLSSVDIALIHVWFYFFLEHFSTTIVLIKLFFTQLRISVRIVRLAEFVASIHNRSIRTLYNPCIFQGTMSLSLLVLLLTCNTTYLTILLAVELLSIRSWLFWVLDNRLFLIVHDGVWFDKFWTL